MIPVDSTNAHSFTASLIAESHDYYHGGHGGDALALHDYSNHFHETIHLLPEPDCLSVKPTTVFEPNHSKCHPIRLAYRFIRPPTLPMS